MNFHRVIDECRFLTIFHYVLQLVFAFYFTSDFAIYYYLKLFVIYNILKTTSISSVTLALFTSHKFIPLDVQYRLKFSIFKH